MTREEEIRQKAISEQRSLMESCDWRAGFIAGAKWADKTMIAKACKWLDTVNTDNYMDSGIFQMYDLISDLREYLEE